MAIIKNKIRCKLCRMVIESFHRHDFKTCGCGAVSVDGGKDYLRRVYPAGADPEDYYDDLSEVDETREEDRQKGRQT